MDTDTCDLLYFVGFFVTSVTQQLQLSQTVFSLDYLIVALYVLSQSVMFFAVSIGRNQPLKPDRPKWKSDVPLSEMQLRGKREEFWDTAPAFEGRKEIWDALKAAVYAMEMGDNLMAQAIVDGANISLPHGMLCLADRIM